MTRNAITTAIKAKGGRIEHKDAESTAYSLPVSDDAFLDFRDTIPFNTLWYGTRDGAQQFRVWFSMPVELSR